MASGNGARFVPPSVLMTITQIAAEEFDLESGSGHPIDLEPTCVHP